MCVCVCVREVVSCAVCVVCVCAFLSNNADVFAAIFVYKVTHIVPGLIQTELNFT